MKAKFLAAAVAICFAAPVRAQSGNGAAKAFTRKGTSCAIAGRPEAYGISSQLFLLGVEDSGQTEFLRNPGGSCPGAP